MAESTAPKSATSKSTTPTSAASASAASASAASASTITGEQAVQELTQASQGLLFPSETDAPIEPFFWPQAKPQAKPQVEPQAELLAPSADLLTTHAQIGVNSVKTQSLASFFKPAVAEEDWQNAEEKAQAQRFQALLEAVKSQLKGAKVFRVGEVAIDVYVVGIVADGYAGFQTKVVET